MSTKTLRKRIALVAVASMGFGLMSTVPASAAFTGLGVGAAGLTVTSPTVYIALGDVASTTFQVATTGVVAENDAISYSLGTITKPDGSAMDVAAATTGAAASAKVKLVTGTSADGLTVWATAADTNAVTDTAGATPLSLTLASVRGQVSMFPAAVGTFTVTLTANPTTGADVTTVWTVVVTAPTTGLAVTSKSAASLAASSWGTVTNTSGSATFTTSVDLASTDIGKAVYTLANGYIGTVATVVAGGGTFTAVTTTPTITAVAGWLGTLPATTVGNGLVAGQIAGMTVTAGQAIALNVSLTGSAFQTGKTRANITGIGVAGTSAAATSGSNINSLITLTAPVLAGIYPMTIQYSKLGTFLTSHPSTDAPVASIAFTLTVTAASGLSTALSTALITNTTAATPTTNAVDYAGYKTVNAAIAQVIVSLKNADGLAPTAAHAITASISGAGFVLVDTSTTMAVTTGLRSSVAASSAGVAVVHIGADGTTGKGTVTVYVTDAATLATSVLGTFTVTTYGNVAKLEISTTNFTIGLATGATTGSAQAVRGDVADALGALTTILTPAFIVKTTDAAGNVSSIANGLVPTIVSSNSVSVSGGACVLDNGAGVYSSGDGVGYYNCSFSTTAAAKSGDKATLTVRTLDPATGVTYLSATVDVTVGGAKFKETLSFDKTTYTPGEAMVVTRTAVDSAGNAVADGSSVLGVIFNKYVGGTLPGAGFYVGGKNATSATAPSVFAPVSSGTFEGRMTGYNSSATTTSAIIATSSVSADGAETASSAAADAAAEATDAANAATDAANAAAEAADAATAAAQDAADAVAALSTSVTAMVNALKKQITSLTALIVRIQKKVKA
jgi:hypothetical protein